MNLRNQLHNTPGGEAPVSTGGWVGIRARRKIWEKIKKSLILMEIKGWIGNPKN
jgi:hypothetical protein